MKAQEELLYWATPLRSSNLHLISQSEEGGTNSKSYLKEFRGLRGAFPTIPDSLHLGYFCYQSFSLIQFGLQQTECAWAPLHSGEGCFRMNNSSFVPGSRSISGIPDLLKKLVRR